MRLPESKLRASSQFDFIAVPQHCLALYRSAVHARGVQRFDHIRFAFAADFGVPSRDVGQQGDIHAAAGRRLPERDLVGQTDEIAADAVDPHQEPRAA